MGDVAEYVNGLAEPARSTVDAIYRAARNEVPDAAEGRSYGMPALRYRDKPLLAVMEAKAHLGVYPFSPAVIDALADRLDGFDRTKGTIRCTPDHPLPGDVVAELVALRRDEIDAAAKRR